MAFFSNHKDKLVKFERKDKKKHECMLGEGRGEEKPTVELKHSLEFPSSAWKACPFFKGLTRRLGLKDLITILRKGTAYRGRDREKRQD